MAEKGVGVCWRKSGVVVCVLRGIPHGSLECLDKECRFLLIVISGVTAFEQRNEEKQFVYRWDCGQIWTGVFRVQLTGWCHREEGGKRCQQNWQITVKVLGCGARGTIKRIMVPLPAIGNLKSYLKSGFRNLACCGYNVEVEPGEYLDILSILKPWAIVFTVITQTLSTKKDNAECTSHCIW